MCVVCGQGPSPLALSRPLPPPPPCHCYCRDAAAATLGARFPKLRDTTRSAAVPSLNARAVGPWRRPCVGISRASSSAVRAHRAQPGPDRRLLCCPNHRRPRRRPRRRRHRPARHLARERSGSCVCGVARARRPCRGSTGWRGMRTATSARAVRTGFRKGITRAVARREAPLETFPGNRVRGSRGLRVCVAIGASTASGIGSKVRLVAHPHHPECDWRLDEPPKLHPASKPCRGVKRRILCVNRFEVRERARLAAGTVGETRFVRMRLAPWLRPPRLGRSPRQLEHGVSSGGSVSETWFENYGPKRRHTNVTK